MALLQVGGSGGERGWGGRRKEVAKYKFAQGTILPKAGSAEPLSYNGIVGSAVKWPSGPLVYNLSVRKQPLNARNCASVLVNSGVCSLGVANIDLKGMSKALPVASFTQCINSDIISPMGAADSVAWPAAAKGISIPANNKKAKQRGASCGSADERNTAILTVVLRAITFLASYTVLFSPCLIRICHWPKGKQDTGWLAAIDVCSIIIPGPLSILNASETC